MSQDILGSLVRVLVTVPEHRLGLMQDYARKLAGSDGADWERQGKLFLRKKSSWPSSSLEARDVKGEVATVQIVDCLKKLDITCSIPAMAVMLVANCLARDSKTIERRDEHLDTMLSAYAPAFEAGSTNTFELVDPAGTTYRDMAESLLAVSNSDSEQAQLLRERGCTFHLEQIGDLIRRTVNKENTGLLNNGQRNFFFIEDADGKVFGLIASLFSVKGWSVAVNHFDRDTKWPEGRFFSRAKV